MRGLMRFIGLGRLLTVGAIAFAVTLAAALAAFLCDRPACTRSARYGGPAAAFSLAAADVRDDIRRLGRSIDGAGRSGGKVSVFDMTGIPDDGSLEDQLKWRRFADRVDRLFKPSRRKRAELGEGPWPPTRRRPGMLDDSPTNYGPRRRNGSRDARGGRPTNRTSISNTIRNPTRIRNWTCSGSGWRSSRIARRRCSNPRQTADTIIRLVAGGNAGSDGRGTVDGRP